MKTPPCSLLACLSAALLLAACGEALTGDGPDETVGQKVATAPGGGAKEGYPDDGPWSDAVANRDAAKKNNGRRPPGWFCQSLVDNCETKFTNCSNCRRARADMNGTWSCEEPCADAAGACRNAAVLCGL